MMAPVWGAAREISEQQRALTLLEEVGRQREGGEGRPVSTPVAAICIADSSAGASMPERLTLIQTKKRARRTTNLVSRRPW